ncbi:MAG: YbjN domain-containing protein [Amphiplicatus sp.]
MAGTRWLAAAALAGAAMTASAAAEMKSAVTAEEIEAMLDAAGLNPTMSEDAATRAPVAYGRAGEVTFFVRALDCGGRPAACETLMFFANFGLGREVGAEDARILNRFNERQVFGRAYFIEGRGEVGVDYVIELGGGVTSEHLAKNVGRWSDVIAAFLDNFRSERGAS